jgi:hypothetical protein
MGLNIDDSLLMCRPFDIVSVEKGRQTEESNYDCNDQVELFIDAHDSDN